MVNYYKVAGRAFLNPCLDLSEISSEDLNNNNLIFEGESKDEVIAYLQPIFEVWAKDFVRRFPNTISVQDQQELISLFFYCSLKAIPKP